MVETLWPVTEAHVSIVDKRSYSAETETQAKGRMFYISCLQWKENKMAAPYTSTELQWCEI